MDTLKEQTEGLPLIEPGYPELVDDISDILKKYQFKRFMKKIIRVINRTQNTKDVKEADDKDTKSIGKISDSTLIQITKKLAPHLNYVPTNEFNFKMDILKRKRVFNAKLEERIQNTLKELKTCDPSFDENKLHSCVLEHQVCQAMNSHSELAACDICWSFGSNHDGDNVSEG